MYRQIHYYLQNCTGTWKTVPSKCDWKSLFLSFFFTPGKHLIMQLGQLNRLMNSIKKNGLKNIQENGG